MEARLYLLGMPGSGKSTLGRQLARAWGWHFADLDTEIAQRTGLSVPQIFERHGEAFFRETEAAALRACRATPLVVATGGGTPCFGHNLAWMNAHGLTVWLAVSLAELVRRLTSEAQPTPRPLLGQAAQLGPRLAALHAARAPIYAQASLHAADDALTVTELARLVEHYAPALAPSGPKRK